MSYGERGAAGLPGCPRERLPSPCAHLAREEPVRGGASLPRPRCLPWGLTFHFPLFQSQAGPTSQTCKLRPENIQQYLRARVIVRRGRVGVESHFTGEKVEIGKEPADLAS